MKKRIVFKEKSLTASVIAMVAIVVLFIITYIWISIIIEDRCLKRMEEGVDTVIGEIF